MAILCKYNLVKVMRIKKFRHFVGDFETTVYEGQKSTEVWASAVVELYSEDIQIFHSLEDTFNYLVSLKDNVMIYYHNLKFDGSFWVDWLLKNKGFEQAFETEEGDEEYALGHWMKDYNMKNNSFKYAISDRGQWYNIIIRVKDHIIEIRDSLKLLPFSVKAIGESFQTKHKKLDMEYTGFRYAGCEITPEEQEYIKNDVLVVKEALEIMYNEGHSKITIGSCCLDEYKKLFSNKKAYEEFFPNLYMEFFNKEFKDRTGCNTIGDYIRRSYKGGWCYLVRGKENRIFKQGTTADVNSLYPSMMSSESGNKYPVGIPVFWEGNEIPEEAMQDDRYFFIRIRCKFKVKPGKLPFIQIKGSFLYKATEMLETSDIKGKDGIYYSCYTGLDGKRHEATVTMVLTQTDYALFLEHYDVTNFEILDGCYFHAVRGLFDSYITKYKRLKMESKGAMRELAKLFLNNLYGKMAANTDSSFKVCYIKEDQSIGQYPVSEYEKKPGFIPIGSAITSYARNFTIRAAQKNFHGIDQPGFIYADTDSIHCDLKPDEIQGIVVHDKNFCCWKLESCWDTGIFARQKTYIEHVTHENLKEIEKPYYNIKCAGMPQRCKNWLLYSFLGKKADELTEEEKESIGVKEFKQEEIEFLMKKRTMEDFKIGLKVPGKLMPKRIPGGTVLIETTYEMR